jgi:hypothetical protein
MPSHALTCPHALTHSPRTPRCTPRARLFKQVNQLPTLFEIVTGRAAKAAKAGAAAGYGKGGGRRANHVRGQRCSS